MIDMVATKPASGSVRVQGAPARRRRGYPPPIWPSNRANGATATGLARCCTRSRFRPRGVYPGCLRLRRRTARYRPGLLRPLSEKSTWHMGVGWQAGSESYRYGSQTARVPRRTKPHIRAYPLAGGATSSQRGGWTVYSDFGAQSRVFKIPRTNFLTDG